MPAPPAAPTTGRSTRTGTVLVVATAIAVAVQCYGLYRPEGPPQPEWLPYADKFAHLLGFALPVLLVLLTVGWFGGAPSRTAVAIVTGGFAVQAVGSELVQAAFYPERSGDVLDVVADGVGIVLGVLAFRFCCSRGWPRRRPARRRVDAS